MTCIISIIIPRGNERQLIVVADKMTREVVYNTLDNSITQKSVSYDSKKIHPISDRCLAISGGYLCLRDKDVYSEEDLLDSFAQSIDHSSKNPPLIRSISDRFEHFVMDRNLLETSCYQAYPNMGYYASFFGYCKSNRLPEMHELKFDSQSVTRMSVNFKGIDISEDKSTLVTYGGENELGAISKLAQDILGHKNKPHDRSETTNRAIEHLKQINFFQDKKQYLLVQPPKSSRSGRRPAAPACAPPPR